MADEPRQPAAAQNPPDAEMMRTPTDEEQAPLDPRSERDLWQGRQSWKTTYPTVFVWTVVTILAIILVAVWQKEWTGPLIAAGVGVLIMLAMLARTAYSIFSNSYRITTQRLFIRRGILTQTVNQTELLRVDDVKMTQTLLERVLGIGTVDVLSSDRTDASIRIVGVAEPAQVAEHIRRHTRTLQKRTLFMENL